MTPVLHKVNSDENYVDHREIWREKRLQQTQIIYHFKRKRQLTKSQQDPS